MTKENRFEGLMGVVGKNRGMRSSASPGFEIQGTDDKNAQTSKHTDVQKPSRRKKPSSKPDVETSKSSNIQTSKVQEHSDKSDISASKHLNVQTSKKAKSANPDYTRTTMYLPKKMHKQLKAIALDEEKEMSSIVEELIDTWLSSRQ